MLQLIKLKIFEGVFFFIVITNKKIKIYLNNEEEYKH